MITFEECIGALVPAPSHPLRTMECLNLKFAWYQALIGTDEGEVNAETHNGFLSSLVRRGVLDNSEAEASAEIASSSESLRFQDFLNAVVPITFAQPLQQELLQLFSAALVEEPVPEPEPELSPEEPQTGPDDFLKPSSLLLKRDLNEMFANFDRMDSQKRGWISKADMIKVFRDLVDERKITQQFSTDRLAEIGIQSDAEISFEKFVTYITKHDATGFDLLKRGFGTFALASAFEIDFEDFAAALIKMVKAKQLLETLATHALSFVDLDTTGMVSFQEYATLHVAPELRSVLLDKALTISQFVPDTAPPAPAPIEVPQPIAQPPAAPVSAPQQQPRPLVAPTLQVSQHDIAVDPPTDSDDDATAAQQAPPVNNNPADPALPLISLQSLKETFEFRSKRPCRISWQQCQDLCSALGIHVVSFQRSAPLDANTPPDYASILFSDMVKVLLPSLQTAKLDIATIAFNRFSKDAKTLSERDYSESCKFLGITATNPRRVTFLEFVQQVTPTLAATRTFPHDVVKIVVGDAAGSIPHANLMDYCRMFEISIIDFFVLYNHAYNKFPILI
eukprot:c17165_g1_i2.p1 GENE.c17165_g1_i2~~c17165_g1_i2.p1  ORF type:complete len:635 (+),score=157.21 c17165_g1_i2:211-1905(+)